jgi:GT2 family glycosyltransferase
MARGSDVVFVCLPSNVGYAAGANRRIERALELLPEAVLVMNNDVEAETGAAKKLVARRVADASVGEAFLARADVIRACRGFDERYVSYFDDVDLSVRAHRAGWRLEVVPGAVFRHAVGASGAPIRGVVFRARNHTLFLHSALGRGRVRSALLGGYAAGEQVLRVAVRRRPTAAAVWAAGSLRLPSDRA